MRRFGDPAAQGQTYTRRPGAYVLLPLDGSVLLTFQQSPIPEFQLPGGGIDPGETAIQALHRETLEETGWSIAAPRKLGVYKRFTFMPEYDLWAEKICHIYVARPIKKLCDPSEEGHFAHWISVCDLPSVIESEGDLSFAQSYFS